MATTKYIDIKLRTKSAETSADKLDGKMKGLGATVDKTSNSFGALSKVAAAVGTAIVTGQITRYADAWTTVNNRLRSATKTNDEFLMSQKGVIAIAQEAGVGLSGVADSYSRIAQNTEHLGLSQDRVLDITRKLTLAIKAGGATSQEAASTLVQFGQGLGTNALQGEELKAIMEASIPVTKALAKEFGVSTGELKKLGSEGKLTADRVVSAIENMDKKSLTFTKGFSDGVTEISNALTIYIGKIGESSGATNSIVDGMSSLAKNIDFVVNGAALIASVFAAKLIPSILATTKAKLALVTASAVSAKASVAEASAASAESIASKKLTVEKAIQAKETLQLSIAKKAATTESVILARATSSEAAASLAASREAVKLERLNVNRGVTSQVLAQKIQLRTNATLQAAAADKALATAETAVSVSSQKLTASKTAASIAIANTTKAKAASATASATLATANASATRSSLLLASAARAATTAMTFLGGPLGIALIAATALYTFGDSVTDLNGKVSTVTPEMDAFAASIEKMSRGAKSASLANINKKMKELRDELTIATKAADKADERAILAASNGSGFSLLAKVAEDARAKVKGINDELELLSQKQGIIVGAPDLSNGTNRGNINDEQPKSTTAPTNTKKSQYSINLAQETEALQIELALRQQVEQGYLSQRDADLSASYIADELKRATQFEAEMIKLGEQELLKGELQAQYYEAAKARQELFEGELTGLKEKGVTDRTKLDQIELQSKVAMAQGVLGVISAFAGKSKTLNKAIMIAQGALSAFQIYASSEAAAAMILATPPGPILNPSLVPAAAAVSLKGKISAAGVLAGAVGSAFSSGGGGGSISASSAVTAPTTPPASTTAPPVRNRTVDIRTDGSAFSEAVKDAALVLFNSGDDDVVLNITNAQNELIRTGGAG